MLTRSRRCHCATALGLSVAVALIPAARGTAQCSAQLIDQYRPSYVDAADQFGVSLAAGGNWLAVGVRGDEPAGSVQMYSIGEFGGGLTLTPGPRLEPPDFTVSDNFGTALAMHGTTLLVGASAHDDGGAAYIYEYDGVEWSFEAQLKPNDLVTNDAFGNAVAIVDGRVAIGAKYQEGIDGKNLSGAVYVYERVNGNWQLFDKLTEPPSDDTPWQFGTSVAFYDESLLVGTMTGDDSIVVFDDNGSSYEFESRIVGQTPTAQLFGQHLSIAGNRLFVGVPDDTIDGPNSGAVHMYDANVFGQWSPAGVLRPIQPEEGLYFGWSVSAYERTLLVGAGDELNGQSFPGTAFLFNKIEGEWVQRDRLTPTDLSDDAQFSRSVLSYGDLAVIGAPADRGPILPSYGRMLAYRASHACSCAADLSDENSIVDVFDLLELLEHWGSDGDGAGLAAPYDTINVLDLLAMLSGWGSCP